MRILEGFTWFQLLILMEFFQSTDRDYIDEETDRVDHDVQMMIRRRRDVNSTERIENVERQDFPNLISEAIF